MRAPGVGGLLRRPGARRVTQLATLCVAIALVIDGFWGPPLAPKNLATVLTWVHSRGLLILVIVTIGNQICFACPFTLLRDVARRWTRPHRVWPRPLRSKWVAVVLFVLFLFTYEWGDPWSTPAATALLVVAYAVGIVVVDGLFKHAPFCKWVCPLGQFNFITSMLSPFEVRVRSLETCRTCTTKDCIRGTSGTKPERAPDRAGAIAPGVQRRGCELGLYLPKKVGNLDCTFCLDCVHACPTDNIGVLSRVPAAELWAPGPRSGIGSPLERKEWAALASVFTFGGLLNAFAMVSPVHALAAWAATALSLTSELALLVLLFSVGLLVLPALVLGGSAWLSRSLTRPLSGRREALIAVATRQAFGLIPLGVGIWVSHYCFHFLTGLWTIVPVVQRALLDLGLSVFGAPRWTWSGLPATAVYPLEFGVLCLGLMMSVLSTLRLSRGGPLAALPWLVSCGVLFAAAVWLLSQPMEMRGTLLAG